MEVKKLSIFILCLLSFACAHTSNEQSDNNGKDTTITQDLVQAPIPYNPLDNYQPLTKVAETEASHFNFNHFDIETDSLWNFIVITEPISENKDWYYVCAESSYPANAKGNINILLIPKDTMIFKYIHIEEEESSNFKSIENVKKICKGLFNQQSPLLLQQFDVYLLLSDVKDLDKETTYTTGQYVTKENTPYHMYEYTDKGWSLIAELQRNTESIHQSAFDFGEYLLKQNHALLTK